MRNHNYYVYLLASHKQGTLYTGMTNNLERRVSEHKLQIVEGFTKDYGVAKLVYYELFQDVNAAIRREKQLKRWHREWKIALITKDNPDWKDLSLAWV
jgi:putative endonuclease